MTKKIVSFITSAVFAVLCVTPYNTAVAADTGLVEIASAEAEAGETVELPIEMKTNPGIAAMSLLLSYDTDKLELISVADGKILGSSSFTPGGDVTAVPYKLNWDDLAAENNTGTGTLATASFRVKDGVSGEAKVTAQIDQSSTFDVDYTEIPFEIISGSISITSHGSSSEPTITVSSVSAAAGQETEVPVMLECNPGVAAMSLALTYDTDKLELLGASDGKILGNSTFSPGNDLTAVPYKLNWDDLSTENNTGNGILVTLRFMVRDGASGEAEVCLKVDQKSTFNIDFTEVPFEVVNGSISIKELTTAATTTTTTTSTTTTTATTSTTASATTTSATTASTTTSASSTTAATTTKAIVPPTIFGDVNDDNTVDRSDYSALTGHLGDSEGHPLTAQGESNADVYNRGDGIDENDAAALLAWLNGDIARLPYDGKLPGAETTAVTSSTTAPTTTTTSTTASTTTTATTTATTTTTSTTTATSTPSATSTASTTTTSTTTTTASEAGNIAWKIENREYEADSSFIAGRVIISDPDNCLLEIGKATFGIIFPTELGAVQCSIMTKYGNSELVFNEDDTISFDCTQNGKGEALSDGAIMWIFYYNATEGNWKSGTYPIKWNREVTRIYSADGTDITDHIELVDGSIRINEPANTTEQSTTSSTASSTTTTVTTAATTTTTVPDNSLQTRARAIIASIGTDPHEIYKYVSGNNSYKSLGTVNSYSQIEKLGWEYFAEYALNNKYVSSEYFASVSSLLFEAAGHENRIVMGTGRGTGLYYWNQVLVNGEWLNFDACNGFDGEPTDYLEKPGYETGKGYTTDAYIYHSFFTGAPTTTDIPAVTTTASTSAAETTTTTTTSTAPSSGKDLGDVNEDGKIDAKDASLILVTYAKVSTGSEGGLTERQYKSADVNSDGKIDAKDASSILAYYALVSTTTKDVPTLKEFITG